MQNFNFFWVFNKSEGSVNFNLTQISVVILNLPMEFKKLDNKLLVHLKTFDDTLDLWGIIFFNIYLEYV